MAIPREALHLILAAAPYRREAQPAGCCWRKVDGTYACNVPEEFVKDQVHIRNAEAAQLARALARQTGKTLTEIVLDALQQYRPGPRCPTREDRVETWRRLLREDREGMTEPETSVESLNDDAMGLPA